MEPIILDSARKHGIADEDTLHAYRQFIDVWQLRDDFTMRIGADRVGRLIEVGVVVDDDGEVVIIHSMPARAKFLR